MRIGHLLLENQSESARRVATLVRALSRLGVEQHVLTGDQALLLSLNQSLGASERIKLGPRVRTPVMACCLMPDVDLAHVHDLKSGQAALLLALTRSIPYVISQSAAPPVTANAITRSIYNRSRCVVCRSEAERTRLRSVSPHALIELLAESGDGIDGDSDAEGERTGLRYLRLYERMASGTGRTVRTL